MSKWIIGHFPSDYHSRTYVEPYCGGCNVLLNKPRSLHEVVNDLDPSVVAILRSVKDECNELTKRLRMVTYDESTFVSAKLRAANGVPYKNNMEYAINEMILRRMSRGGLKTAFAWSQRKRGGRPGDLNAWMTILDQLSNISERLQGVAIHNMTAIEAIRAYDDPMTLLYCDPTYLKETRVSKNAYQFEMSYDDHEELAHALNQFQGKVLISGYSSDAYSKWFKNWNLKTIEIANHASQQKVKPYKTECLWLNY